MKKILTIVSILLFAVIIVACGKKDFKVTFVTNGGTAVSAVDVKSGDKISEPTTTKKLTKLTVGIQQKTLQKELSGILLKIQ